jgi:hypothetical protein
LTGGAHEAVEQGGMVPNNQALQKFLDKRSRLVGMKDEAIRYIKKGNEEGFQLIKDYLYPYPLLMSNPFFENLRNDPRFQEVVRNEKKRFDEKNRQYGAL